MVTIPSGQAARQAWAALPDGVRASVVERAARYEGHPDPAVAAVAVGVIRAENRWPWLRQLILVAGLAVLFGVLLAVVGQRFDGHYTYLPVIPAAAAGLAAVAALVWPAKRAVPRHAEAANLLVFLGSADAIASPVRDRGRERQVYWSTAAVIVAAPAVAWLCVRAFGLHFEAVQLIPLSVADILGMVVGPGLAVGLANVYRPKHWAQRVAVGEDGVRFGRPWIRRRTQVVPWTDVVDVTLDGPDHFRPGEPGKMVWRLRDGLEVRVPLHGSRREPEDLILAARSYLDAARAARTA